MLGISVNVVADVTPTRTPLRVISNDAVSEEVQVQSSMTFSPETIDVKLGHGNAGIGLKVNDVELMAPETSVTKSVTSTESLCGISKDAPIPVAPPPAQVHRYRTIELSGSAEFIPVRTARSPA